MQDMTEMREFGPNTKEQIKFSKEFVEQLVEAVEEGGLVGAVGSQPSKRSVSGLRSLLASHSSSRTKIRKDNE